MNAHPGWPVVLRDGEVLLRPYRRRDAAAWSEVRLVNRAWLAPWEATPSVPWREANSRTAYGWVFREQRRAARAGESMPFAVCVYDEATGAERYVGHMNLSGIVRRAFCSAFAGYWIDARFAGRGITPTALALAVDHGFHSGGLHRIEVNIRPENTSSRRVVEKLGFREEALHPRYLHIDGAWRDHIGYGLTIEDVAEEGGLVARWHRLRTPAS
jgi:ribosomal-protein-alanine N-acetyltransferase